jgi:hypothetical protein
MRSSHAVFCAATFCSSSVLLLGCSGDLGSSSPAEDEAASTQELPGSGPGDAKREDERVRAFLDARYMAKDVHHSFHTKFGETIDCIDFFAQQGVKELAARGTPIKELPVPPAQPNIPPDLQDVFFTGTPDDEGKPRACPRGSVPILRVSAEQIRIAGGLDAFVDAHRYKVSPFKVEDGSEVAPPAPNLSNYGHVTQEYTGSDPVIAARATLNIAKPSVIGGAAVTNHAIMQAWLVDDRNGTTQTVEVGTNVAPTLYGNRNTHFFIFATSNNYGNGCYNNVSGKPSSCLTWVGYSGATLTPGMTLSTSTFNGTQRELQILLYYYRGAWNIDGAGYYPATNFTGPMASGSANRFLAGGEVYDVTQSWYVPMGSGADPRAGYGQAAYWNAPGDNGLSIIDLNGIFNTTSFGSPSSTRPSDYFAINSDGRFLVGPELKRFFNQNYGFQWSAIGDWAPGNFKAQCHYNNAGVPLKGVAANPNGASSEAILCGDWIQSGIGNQCYARSFANGDNRGSFASGNWDPGYVKGECGYMEVATGIAQSTSHRLNTILCCPQRNNADHVSCTVENFGSSNSPSVGSGPDWAYGFYKGMCPVGKAVVGISRKSTGAAHALLCCAMT